MGMAEEVGFEITEALIWDTQEQALRTNYVTANQLIPPVVFVTKQTNFDPCCV